MGFIVELSGEHPTLPEAEVRSLLDLEGGALLRREALLSFVEGSDRLPEILSRRAGLVHRVDRHWFSVPPTPRSILPPFSRIDLGGSTFRVKAHRIQGFHPELSLDDLVRGAGALLAEKGRVDLESPEIEVRILVAEEVHVGALLVEIPRKEFERRALRNRPFFSPISLHPRLARALVNLSRVREGGRMADPFAGTGGIALEASLMGIHVVAGDLDPRMVEGARRVFEEYGPLPVEIGCGDVEEILESVGSLDAIVTDPPYGRASSTHREERRNLYRRFLRAAHKALSPSGRIVSSFPHPQDLELLAEEGLTLEEIHPVRVHRSLTRHVFVARR